MIVPIEIVELENDSIHIFVSCQINNISYELIIDTGASKTVLDLNSFSEIVTSEIDEDVNSSGIGAEKIDVKIGNIEHFKIGEIIKTNYNLSFVDLSHINNLYSNYTNKVVHGLLGSDFLYTYNGIINYKEKTLTLENIEL